MSERSELTAFERELQLALRELPAGPAPECPGTEDLIALIEGGPRAPGFQRLLAHVPLCAHCRLAYAELERALQLARPGPAGAAPMQIPVPPVRRGLLRFDWALLAAATAEEEPPAEAFCDGALRVSVWLDGDDVVLTAENNAAGSWRPEDDGSLAFHPGAGTGLAGRLFRFDLEGPTGDLGGYFVLPEAPEISVAELTLGSRHEWTAGELSCRLAEPGELEDPGVVRESIERSRDRPTREAWRRFAAAAELPAGVLSMMQPGPSA